jgi:hypothetical protein
MIKRIPTPDMQRWPVNSTRFLLPCIAVKGWPGGAINVILCFWVWRVDFQYMSNAEVQPRGENAATPPDKPTE